MCETFPPNKREVCLIARASIKVGSENRLRFRRNFFDMIPAQPQCAAAERYPLVGFVRATLYAARFRNMFAHVDL
jgi:hypothetical protein